MRDGDQFLLRRLHAVAALEPVVSASNRTRAERGRQVARRLFSPLAEENAQTAPAQVDEAANLIFALTAFEPFDTLVRLGRRPRATVPVVLA